LNHIDLWHLALRFTFYEGKTIRIIVGYSAGEDMTPTPGSSPGIWANIPGNPHVIVET
jgi:hypothetical protein